MNKSNLTLVTKEKSCAHSRASKRHGMPYGKDLSNEIIDLHDEILQTGRLLLPKVLRVGELLAIQKQRLPHGQFTSWITENLPFSSRTAQHYMKVFRHRKKLKNEKVSVLSDAYNLLKSPRIKAKESGKNYDQRNFLTLSLYQEEKEWIDDALKKAKGMLETDSNSRALQLILYEWFMSSFDQSEKISMEQAKKAFETIYGVQIVIKRKQDKEIMNNC